MFFKMGIRNTGSVQTNKDKNNGKFAPYYAAICCIRPGQQHSAALSKLYRSAVLLKYTKESSILKYTGEGIFSNFVFLS